MEISFFIKNNKYEYIIGRKGTLDKYDIDCQKILFVEDLRSAAFLGIGIIQNSKEKVLIVIDECDLANGYTAFTEASFQNTSLHVLMISNSNTYDELYDRCFYNVYYYSENLIIEENKGPVMIVGKSIVTRKSEREEYSIPYVFTGFEGEILCAKNISVSCMTARKISRWSDNQGIISYYVGMLAAKKEDIICICTDNQLLTDINIFNNRYTNDKFKLVVCGELACKEWIMENEFSIFSGSEIEKFLTSNQKSILVIKG